MIWELSLDGTGDNSLLKAIYEKAPKAEIAALPLAEVSGVSDRRLVVRHYPSPARTTATISIGWSSPATLSIEIIDCGGRTVDRIAKSKPLSAGNHDFIWNAKGPSGVYQHKLTLNRGRDSRILRTTMVVIG